MTTGKNDASRRDFLFGAAAAGAGAALTGCTQAPAPAPARTEATTAADDNAVLQSALALEHEGIAVYQELIDKGPLLEKEVRALVGDFLRHHIAHRDALEGVIRSRSETPVAKKANYDYKRPTDRDGWLKLAADTENKAANAYADAIGKFSARSLAVQAAKILAAEAWHTAVLRQILHENPAPDWQLTAT